MGLSFVLFTQQHDLQHAITRVSHCGPVAMVALRTTYPSHGGPTAPDISPSPSALSHLILTLTLNQGALTLCLFTVRNAMAEIARKLAKMCSAVRAKKQSQVAKAAWLG